MKKITYSEPGCSRWDPVISVVTPTIRKEGLDIIKKSLEKQTWKSFEWIIGSPFDPEIEDGKFFKVRWVKDDFKDGFWSLNRIYNKIFKECRGTVIVSLQDWIHIPPRGLEAFLEAFKEVGEAVISGVGDQYEQLNEFGKPEVKIWSDPRKHDGGLYECYPNDAEWNWCAFSKKFIYEVGGMDEQLDFLGVGGDQLQVGERWDAMGKKFYLDQSNESFTLRHGREDFGGQKEWDSKHVLFRPGKTGKSLYDERKKELIKSGKWPVLDFLP